MKDQNYDRLRKALDRLPEYQPPTAIWRGMEDGLVRNEDKPDLQMPGYSPPTSVWNRLSTDLDVDDKKRGRIRSMSRWAVRIAASALIFTAGFFYATYDEGPKVRYSYGEEAVNAAMFTAQDWNDEEASFARVMEQLSDIDEPELNALRLELEELTAAKKDVEAMLRSYGNDHRMIGQLAEIESERSRVYRLAIAEL